MSIKQRLDSFQSMKNFGEDSCAKQRIYKIVDPDSFVEINSMTKSQDDYTGVITGIGKIGNRKVCLFSQDNKINGGAFTTAQVNKILNIYTIAQTTGVPVVGIYDCKGASLDDANLLLKGLSDLLAFSNKLSGVVPQISLILGPCLGINALLAANADFVIAAKNSNFSINTGDSDSDIFSAAKEGSVSVLSKDEDEAIASLKNLFDFLPSNNLDKSPLFNALEPQVNEFDSISDKLYNLDPNVDYNLFLKSFADNNGFITLQDDFGKTAIIAFARLNGVCVGTVIFKGEELCSHTCSKVARFIRFCDAFSIPVVTFANSKEFTSLANAAKLTNAYCDATTAKLSVIIGKAFGSVFAATSMQQASSDITLAWVSSSVSAMNPTAAAIFYNSEKLKNSDNPIDDRKKLIKDYIQNSATPFDMASLGLIQNVILPSQTRSEISKLLEVLESKRIQKLPKKHSNINL
ncbi:MAG: carboxyl transferase domain-containing protein [Clostridia bacterium]|nr:carboxyl transferase domain-containing protein [Clostridia bacterium]